jgi:hypothetical protein
MSREIALSPRCAIRARFNGKSCLPALRNAKYWRILGKNETRVSKSSSPDCRQGKFRSSASRWTLKKSNNSAKKKVSPTTARPVQIWRCAKPRTKAWPSLRLASPSLHRSQISENLDLKDYLIDSGEVGPDLRLGRLLVGNPRFGGRLGDPPLRPYHVAVSRVKSSR